MANGAPSNNMKRQTTIAVDPGVVPPTTIEQFVTGTVNTIAHDEERDEANKITQQALVEVQMTEPPLILATGDGIVGRGFTRRITKLSPELAIELGKALQAEGEKTLASMKEQPLKSSSLTIANGDGDVAAAAAALDQIKGKPA